MLGRQRQIKCYSYKFGFSSVYIPKLKHILTTKTLRATAKETKGSDSTDAAQFSLRTENQNHGNIYCLHRNQGFEQDKANLSKQNLKQAKSEASYLYGIQRVEQMSSKTPI